MILLAAVLIGLCAGLLRALCSRSSFRAPPLRMAGLVIVALSLQFMAFGLPATREGLPVPLVASMLVASLVLLLVFAWVNRRQAGFWLLGLGLALNLAVIAANGGLMPINPENASRLVPQVASEEWKSGRRFGLGKDVVLKENQTHLAPLSDRFLLPAWSPARAAFSLGDILIALGAVSLLWSMGRPQSSQFLQYQY